jgi:3'-phosphoadenosine 5'-phosphosulfate sulfotransferase (PAPS reductase)/FAD synthetase
MQDIEENLKRMQVRRWCENIRKTEEWGSILREAKGHPGLWHQGRRRR